MAYGIEILTSTGKQSSDALNTYGIFYILQCSSQEGSATVSAYDSTKGFFVPRIQDSNNHQSFTWNNTTKLFSWAKTNGNTHSSNFTVAFFRGAV